MTSNGSPDPADAIAAALARLRGRRMPRPPWDAPHHHGADSPWGHGPSGGHHGGPHFGSGGARFGGGGGPGGPGWPGGGRGVPPWAAAGRFGGPARLRLLEALAAASVPLSVSEVGDAIGVDQPRASRLVQQAAELGLVRREADPDDARRTRIVLTDEGRALVRGFRGERREAVDAALTGFTDAERAELARLLTKLADAWPRA
ncbi:MarR family winged helix-turn-helix transcriptional regulator [Microbacterium sp. F51-2R]|uniref:MarR family winged helix-turn-helix transcriptional regulator n=1 Tax=Microbacterium sp. F51-2R TaxID=3445777 RepID=UPI003F9F6139